MSWKDYFNKGFGGTKDGSTFMLADIKDSIRQAEYVLSVEKKIIEMRKRKVKANG